MNTTEQIANKYIFSLDIGTRSVIGIVGYRDNDLFNVMAMEKLPHKKRAMIDGQIEDIEQVADIVKEVKARLEDSVGFKLTDVYVAAAGRSLKTVKSTFKTEINPNISVTNEQIKDIEMNAIAIAQENIYKNDNNDEQEQNMICVGYSVITYYIDNYKMSTILGHKGKEIQVDIIATFLPNPVVDSLRSAMNKSGLNIINMTLEPIAASNAVIPQELRLLNLALVDIGAGTSDIAISNEGSITAYTMATVAGDEVTEAIMQKLLVDFNEAERIKQILFTGVTPINYTNILGIEAIESKENILEYTQSAVQNIANEIAQRILDCNGKIPAAIFLVGGGSKSPNLVQYLSEKLQMEENKIAVGGSNYMKKQTVGNIDANDPELATPLGIAISAMNFITDDDIAVTVNGEELKLIKTTGCTVMNALLMSGIKYSAIMGRNGKSITFSLNDKTIVARGGLSQSAEITVNGNVAHISTILNNGDKVEVKTFPQGEDACVKISDYVKVQSGTVSVDNTRYKFGTMASINGIALNSDTIINDFDKIEVSSLLTFGDLCNSYGLDFHKYICNGEIVNNDLLLENNMTITTYTEPQTIEQNIQQPIIDTVTKENTSYYTDSGTLITEQAQPTPNQATQKYDNSQNNTQTIPYTNSSNYDMPTFTSAKSIKVTLNGQLILLPAKADTTPYLFLDMLNYIDIDPTKPMENVELLLNGTLNPSYLQQLNDGDVIQIKWKNK